MNCREAQEKILASFDGDVFQGDRDALDKHLSECATCSDFAISQSRLDLLLREQIIAPQLSASFRAAVRAKVALKHSDMLPAWLPDVAYVAGSVTGLALCAVLLPFAAPTVIAMGTSVAIAVYLLQTFLRTALHPSIE
jgi:hypothetical protein